jgi:CubicO group peptidase (beta-lactamase class C family)
MEECSMNREHLVLGWFLLVTMPLAAQRPARAGAGAPPAGWSDFVRAFDAYAMADSVVGASVLMLQDGRIRVRHDYGFADRANAIRTGPETIYHWGSITKTLTAIAILQLRDHGRLTLDDAVTHWVPELRQVHDAYGSIDAITIRMLLSHSAGFQDPTWPYKTGRSWEPFEPTRWEQLVAMMPYQELQFPPDSRFGYSNPGFIYLARIIEAITNDPWEAYVYKNVWGPLGLDHSYFGTTPYWLANSRSNNYTVTRDSATGRTFVRDNGRDFDPGITIPNGGWNAPLDDLASYLAFLTDATGGERDRAPRYAQVLGRSSLEEMWRSRFAVDSVPRPDSVGLSFFLRNHGGRRFVGHAGWQAGFRSFFYIDPEARTGIVAAFNTTNDVQPDRSGDGLRAVRNAALAMLAATAGAH